MNAGLSVSVAAVVVHYRTPNRLMACVAALERQSHACADIVVVDNSGDTDAAADPTDHDRWRLLRTERNLGFGAACNLGARCTGSDYLLFVNADLVPVDDACERLCAMADADASLAVVGPRIYDSDGRVELSARSFPSLRTGVLGRSSLATRLLRRTGLTPSSVSSAIEGRSAIVDWVSGACMLVRRPSFDEVGGFDEAYWMYWEDADICRRLHDRGWRTALCVEAGARHSTGSSGRNVRTIEAFHESAGRYYTTHIARTNASAMLARSVLRMRMKLIRRRHIPRINPHGT